MTKPIATFYFILLSVVAFFNEKPIEKTASISAMPMYNALPEDDVNQSSLTNASIPALPPFQVATGGLEMDSSKIYSMPLLSKMPSNEIMLTWTEKDA